MPLIDPLSGVKKSSLLHPLGRVLTEVSGALEFDPLLSSSDIVLSSSNTVAEKTVATAGSIGTVLVNSPKNSGKWQFEATATVATGSNTALGVTADASPNFLTSLGVTGVTADEPSTGYHKLGRVFWNLSGGDSNIFNSGWIYTTGDVISVCLDLDAATPTASFYKNDTLTHTRVLEAGTDWKPGVSMAAISDSWTITTGSLLFPIAGFDPWD